MIDLMLSKDSYDFPRLAFLRTLSLPREIAIKFLAEACQGPLC